MLSTRSSWVLGLASAAAATAHSGCALDSGGLAGHETTTEPTGATSSTTTEAGGGPTSAGPGGSGAGAGGAGSGGDDLADCPADHECVPVLANGERVLLGPAEADSCPAGWGPPTAYGDGSQPGCEDCSCAAPTQGTCKMGDLTSASSKGCAPDASTVNLGTGCYPDVLGRKSRKLEPAIPPASTCQASQGNPKSALDGARTLCAEPALACGAGHVCLPPAGGAKLCELREAGAGCPEGFGAATVHEILADTRSCDCTCGAPAGQTCPNSRFDILTGGLACGQATLASTHLADGACHNVVDHNWFRLVAGPSSGGECASSSVESGEIGYGQAKTLCCPL